MGYELIIIVPTDALTPDNAHPAETHKCKKQNKQYCVFILLKWGEKSEIRACP